LTSAEQSKIPQMQYKTLYGFGFYGLKCQTEIIHSFSFMIFLNVTFHVNFANRKQYDSIIFIA